jgi:murein DD-endopeptidase MepM/ murein hydrolase activator NlpD
MKRFLAVAPAFLLLTVMDPAVPEPARRTNPRLLYSDLAALPPAALPAHSIVLTVEAGDTLDSVLIDGGLDRFESAQLTREVARNFDLRRLRPGNLVRFHYDAIGRVDSVEIKIVGWGEVDAVRGESGFLVVPQQASLHEIDSVISARIDSSLYDSLLFAGEGPQLAQQIVDIFQWDIDFFALQRGDSFSLVVKKRFAGSDAVGYGPILAARFTHEGQTFEAFRQEMPDGRAGYYSRKGKPLRKQFLRAPLQFTRISSRFSKSRFHPILHCFRPHHGVDYGAPVGTPVMTTADGVVIEAGRKRGEGNYVRIRHAARLDTYYLHLSRFAKGTRRGQKVMQGQVIGYVGATGLATGPHLDYRVLDHGTWLDPLKLKSITADPLPLRLAHQFHTNVARLAPKLAVATSQVAEFAAQRRALF